MGQDRRTTNKGEDERQETNARKKLFNKFLIVKLFEKKINQESLNLKMFFRFFRHEYYSYYNSYYIFPFLAFHLLCVFPFLEFIAIYERFLQNYFL